MKRTVAIVSATVLLPALLSAQQARPRVRDLGLSPGVLPTGTLNAITDVGGVEVGQVTITSGDTINTGITAILPHPGNIFLDKVPAAAFVGNAFGKLVGSTQVNELGELETPILLTCTLCVWRAADAMTGWLLNQPGMDQVRSINPVVGETNDGGLSDIRDRPVTPADVVAALERASGGPVAEGSVGAGRGTQAFGWKGGIGTSSRKLPAALGGWTVGVLVQTNFGGVLSIDGIPVGKELGRYSYRGALDRDRGDGSVMIIVATDAPLNHRQLSRLAARAMLGLGRTGSSASNGSGDFVISFSTAESVRRKPNQRVRDESELSNDAMSPLFLAVIEATEEAIYNSILRATTVSGMGHTADAISIDKVEELIAKYRK